MSLSPILIGDLTEVVVQIAEQRPHAGVFELVGANAYSLEEILRMIQKTLNVRAKHLPIPTWMLYPVAWLAEKFCPGFFSREHLLLLATDNIASPEPLEATLKRSLHSAEAFLTDPQNYH